MTRLETLQEMQAYLKKGLQKAETELDNHRTGRWAPDKSYIKQGEERVEKWARWYDTLTELITSTQNNDNQPY